MYENHMTVRRFGGFCRAWRPLVALCLLVGQIPSRVSAQASHRYQIGVSPELPCEIIRDIRRAFPDGTYQRFEERRREARSQYERYASIQMGHSDVSNAQAAATYDLRFPWLSRIMFYFFSQREYHLPFAIHRLDEHIMAGDEGPIWALVGLQSEAKQLRPIPNLVMDQTIGTRVRDRAEQRNITMSTDGLIADDRFLGRVMKSFSVMASRMVTDLLARPNRSVSHLELYRMASRITDGDALGALGIVSASLFLDSAATPRSRLSVISEKLHPIFARPNPDHAGAIYHFWNYATRALVMPEGVARQRLLSFAYERINQGDLEDFHADAAGIRMAQGIDRALHLNSDVCR